MAFRDNNPSQTGGAINLQCGQVVISKCGRDKGLPLIVVGLEGDYAAVADGNTRPLSRPKRKKLKHLQPVGHIDEAIQRAISEKGHLMDADFKKALEPFRKQ